MPYPLSAVRNKNFGAAPPTYSISGVVRDADGSTAVAGATVALGAASTTSAADGTYTLAGLAPGASGALSCTKTGYSWISLVISAMSGNLTNQNFVNLWWAFGGYGNHVTGAYLPKGAADLAASYVNIANPGTHNMSEGVAPTFSALTGWTGTGTQWLKNGIALTAGCSVIVRFTNYTDGGCLYGGRVSAFNGMFVYSGNYFCNGATLTRTTFAGGIEAICGKNVFRDGASFGTIGAGANTNTYESYIFARNNAGTMQFPSAAKIQAMLFSDTDISAIAAGLTTLMAGL